MANDFYNREYDFTAYTRVRSDQVDQELNGVAAGFALMPSYNDLHEGAANWGTDTGTVNAHVVAMRRTATAYRESMSVRFVANATNTGAATINVDSIGISPLKRAGGTELQYGDIVAGTVIEATRVGNEFRLSDLNVTPIAVVPANYRGDYDAGETYAQGETTSYTDGYVYASKVDDNIGNTPAAVSSYWYRTFKQIGLGGDSTSGSVTLSAGDNAVQKITPTNYGQFLKLPDATTTSPGMILYAVKNAGNYELRVIDAAGNTLGFVKPFHCATLGLSGNSTSAGEWVMTDRTRVGISAAYQESGDISVMHQPIALTADKNIIFYTLSSVLYGVVYDSSTNEWGAPVSIRAANIAAAGIVSLRVSDSVALVCTCITTAFEGVALSVSGTTITVGTAASVTLSNNFSNLKQIVESNGSYVVSYMQATAQMIALTVTGTTVAASAEKAVSGTAVAPHLYDYSDKLIAISYTSGTIYAEPFTMSGTSFAPGTSDSYSGTSAQINRTALMPTGNALIYGFETTNMIGLVVSLSGTTAAISKVNVFAGVNLNADHDMCPVDTDKMLIVSRASGSTIYYNILSDSFGTASVGTAITDTNMGSNPSLAAVTLGSDQARIIGVVSGATIYQNIVDCSGASPEIEQFQKYSVPTNSFQSPKTGAYSGTQAAGAYFINDEIIHFGSTSEARYSSLTPFNIHVEYQGSDNLSGSHIPVNNRLFTYSGFGGDNDTIYAIEAAIQ